SMWERISSSISRSSGLIALVLFRGGRVQDAADGLDELGPPVLLAQELRLSGCRQAVVLGSLLRLADVPLGLQPAALLEAMKRGVERAGLDLQEVFGSRSNGLADAVAVLAAPLEGAQDEHVEGALEELEARVARGLRHGCRSSTAKVVDCLLLSSRDPRDGRGGRAQGQALQHDA